MSVNDNHHEADERQDERYIDGGHSEQAPDADERDRIDFIYYYPMSGFKPVNAYVHGPDSSIVRGKRVKEESQDSFILPEGVWPTDHKAVLVEFSWKKK